MQKEVKYSFKQHTNRIVFGVNDVYTQYPDRVKYFANPEIAKEVGRWTEKRVDVVCPECGHMMQKRVCDFVASPFNCLRCGDGSTYPNKFMYNCLLQLKEYYNFELYVEHAFEWSKHLDSGKTRRLYDFYIHYEHQDYIIEIHGEQHYNGSFQCFKGGKTHEDEVANDCFKKQLALQNGIREENYIVIDARKSNMDWISSAIAVSRLSTLFDIDKVDWGECDRMACKSLVLVAAELYKQGMNLDEIGAKIGRSGSTVSKYLQHADNLNLIVYNPPNHKPVMCLDNQIVFADMQVCSKLSELVLGKHISKRALRAHLGGYNKTTGGFRFCFISKGDYKQIKASEPCRVFDNEYLYQPA